MHIKIEKVNKDVFSPYGEIIEMPVNTEPTVDVETVKFWKQQAMFAIEGETEVGVLKIKRMDMIFNELENHFKTATGLICLDGDCAIAVAPPTDELPAANEIKAFKIEKGQFFVLAEKCWHSATYPLDQDEITLLVFFKKDSLDVDTVFEDMGQQFELVL